MADLHSILLLSLQAALAIAAIELLRRFILPHASFVQSPELIIDVWAPIAIILPMIFFAGRVNATVRGVGWMVSGAPTVCAMLAGGAALCVRRSDCDASKPSNGLWIACAAAGTLALLLGLAHDLTIWMGQCAFAVGAVVLWMNTPELSSVRQGAFAVDKSNSEAGFAMFLMLGCAVGQGVVSVVVSNALAPVSAALMMASAAMMVTHAARIAGPNTALRVGGWGAVYGLSLGLGVLSLKAMIPQVVHILREEPATRVIKIASGFGLYAPEAMLLIGFAALVAMRPNLSANRVALLLGILLIVGAALLTGWRLRHAT